MASYPAEYELDAVLADGDVIQVRPIKPGDADQLIAFHERLSNESRYFRFFRVKETLDRQEAEFFANVDYHDRMALVAVNDGMIVAVGRYDRIERRALSGGGCVRGGRRNTRAAGLPRSCSPFSPSMPGRPESPVSGRLCFRRTSR